MHLISNQNLKETKDAQSPEPTDFESFVARAVEQKQREGNNPTVQVESWVNPDPLAIMDVIPSKHPITVVINRRRGNAQTKKIIFSNMRWVCAHLKGVKPTSLIWEDVMSYPWHHIDVDTAAAYYRSVTAHYQHVNSSHCRIVMLRVIVGTCYRAKLISVTRRDEVLDELPTTSRGISKMPKVRLSESQLTSLLGECAKGEKYEAGLISSIVALFSTTGIRISELVALDLSDWDQVGQTIRLRMTKNGREHVVPVVTGVTEYLDYWVGLRGADDGPLFTQIGNPALIRLSTDSVRNLLEKRVVAAGIIRMKPHDFRRTVASQLLRKHDIALVSRLLNHTTIAATLVYDLASDEEQRAAVTGLSLPSFNRIETELP